MADKTIASSLLRQEGPQQELDLEGPDHMTERTPDYRVGYEAGYNAGYCAGRRKRDRVSTHKNTYQRVSWRCSACRATGVVLWRNDDDNVKKHWRMMQSHASRRNRCKNPTLVRLTAKQTRANKREREIGFD